MLSCSNAHTKQVSESSPNQSIESRACDLHPWAMQCIHVCYLLCWGGNFQGKFSFIYIYVCCSSYSRPSTPQHFSTQVGFTQILKADEQTGSECWLTGELKPLILPAALVTDYCLAHRCVRVCVGWWCSGARRRAHCIGCSQVGTEISLRTHRGGLIVSKGKSTQPLSIYHEPVS